MTTKLLKRSWIEISIPNLIKNTQIFQQNIQNNSSIMAVVKADAYGHGAMEVSRALQESGITDFAVSNVLEAVELREAGIKGQILILGYTPIEDLELLSKYDITQAIISSEYADDLITSNLHMPAQRSAPSRLCWRIWENKKYIPCCEEVLPSHGRVLIQPMLLIGLRQAIGQVFVSI